MTRAAVVLRVLGALVLLWPVLPPALDALGLHALAHAIAYPWSLTCHRLPDRTLSFLGEKMPMCSRCMGLDVGMGIGLLAGAPYRGPKVLWAWLAAATVLLIAEMQTQELGMHPIWHPARALTGALLAFPVGAAITSILGRK